MCELNLEIQFLLKQGQVEVDMGEFVPDFSDSVLVHRSSVEELNSQIKVHARTHTRTHALTRARMHAHTHTQRKGHSLLCMH